jgi:GNAT superfamily N-acetyltransferase
MPGRIIASSLSPLQVRLEVSENHILYTESRWAPLADCRQAEKEFELTSSEHPPVLLRNGSPDDAAAISGLILEAQASFSFHEYSVQGRTLMAQLCSADALRNYLERGDCYRVAFSGGQLIGVIGIREGNHIAHNFVDAQHHQRGISGRLWREARAACLAGTLSSGKPGTFTLQASSYAIPVYVRWVQTASAIDQNGIVSTPMQLTISDAITTRGAITDDRDWLVKLRSSTMDPHLLASGLKPDQAEHQAMVVADFESIAILCVGSERVGMCKVIRTQSPWKLVQIQVVPSLQGIGIGEGVVTGMLRDADKAGVPVELNVLKVNPAQHLYQRLGFDIVADRGSALTMRYTPEAV